MRGTNQHKQMVKRTMHGFQNPRTDPWQDKGVKNTHICSHFSYPVIALALAKSSLLYSVALELINTTDRCSGIPATFFVERLAMIPAFLRCHFRSRFKPGNQVNVGLFLCRTASGKAQGVLIWTWWCCVWGHLHLCVRRPDLVLDLAACSFLWLWKCFLLIHGVFQRNFSGFSRKIWKATGSQSIVVYMLWTSLVLN